MRKKVTDKFHKKRFIVTQTERVTKAKPIPLEPAESFEEKVDADISLKERKENKNERRKSVFIRTVRIFLVLCSIYLAFLIYGVINTDYVYDDTGRVVPLVMNYNQIKELDSFNKLALQYRQARLLYEQVLVLDYRIAAGIEDPLTIAPEYEKMLSSIEPLAIQLSALEVPPEYTQTKNMLLTWTQTDIAIYCQNMSKAISQNSEEHATNALQGRSVVYQDFSVVTQNLISLGSLVDGVDMNDILEWSPEKYIQDTLGAYQGE